MNNKTLLLIVVAVMVLGGGALALSKRGDKNKLASKSSSSMSEEQGMSSMAKEFAGLKGEAYDRKFLADMMVHHQSAIDMAKLVDANAKHQELKTLANDIITAQTSEISQMEKLQKTLGYMAGSGATASPHGSTGSKTSPMDELTGKTGDDFDKTFLKLMTEHHQAALDMARPGATNAANAEVKTLASGIVTAQTKEIGQMKQWQKEWGYAN